MKPSIVTDEISADFSTAVELASAWGIHNFELRGVGEHRVPNLTDYQIQRVREMLWAFDGHLIAISPGLFKFPFPEQARNSFPVQAIDYSRYKVWQKSQRILDDHLHNLLPRAISFARAFDVHLMVCFSFARGNFVSGGPPERLLETLYQAADLASKADIVLALETEAGFWADTGANTAAFVEMVGHPALMVNWDPGNVLQAGETPFPQGYSQVKEKVAHLHFKDLVQNPDGQFSYRIEGDIDWRGQIRALARDGYEGFLSVETHMFPQIKTSEAAVRRLLTLLDDVTNGH